MAGVAEILARRVGLALDFLHNGASYTPSDISADAPSMQKRVFIPCCNSTSPAGLIEAHTLDPWEDSGKYALGWVWFSIILLVATAIIRWYHLFGDKVRIAAHKESMEKFAMSASPATDYELSALATDRSTRKFFSLDQPVPEAPLPEVEQHSMPWIVKSTLAAFRYVLYRPIPSLRMHKQLRPIVFPSIGVCLLVFAALAFTLLYTFIPQPLYWQSIQFGSPPLAIRSGMIAVALMPWIVGLSMKANLISLLTGIGHERLNVLHRWLAYIFLILSIIHTVPFYVTPVWDDGGMQEFHRLLQAQQSGVYIYGTGIAALVPAIFLCMHSLGPLRRKFYELFVVLHVPVSIALLGLLFWHCHNYLTSWHYLWATTTIWLASYIFRLLYLNWANPFQVSWGVGEEAAVIVLEDNAVKVTVPTRVRWKPGQYIYLRMPGVSPFENHPFTIASLCSDDYPSEYGEQYRDMVVVFRPFAGFTKKVLDSALDHGPWWTYRTFIDGPYGGMRRRLDSFEHVVLIAGGTGITAIVSQLLDLIKRMRDGKAVTRSIHLLWAMKRPETMEWFKEELRICREFAPPNTVSCQFYITAAKRQQQTGNFVSAAHTPGSRPRPRPVSSLFHDKKVSDVFHSIASNNNNRHSLNSNPNRRYSTASNIQRHSALSIEAEAEAYGDLARDKELREESTDRLRPLPEAHLKPMRSPLSQRIPPPPPSHSSHLSGLQLHPPEFSPYAYAEGEEKDIACSRTTAATAAAAATLHEKRRWKQQLSSLDTTSAQKMVILPLPPPPLQDQQQEQQSQNQTKFPQSTAAALQDFDFGFPSTPTDFQKNLMRFAFLPATIKPRLQSTAAASAGWSIEWGRPELSYMLQELSKEWNAAGSKACVFVCGPAGMRMDVSATVAGLQSKVFKGEVEEVYLHAENYVL